jgi:gamma-glutamylcyclotransferase (GGCT)/AIG2-like uncharacterized protein YtfP
MGAAFVYGTLMPGRLRWSSVAAHVVEHREAAVSGTLVDTGRGYPGLRLAGDGLVHGWLLELHPTTEATVWEKLDVVEGPDYRRVALTTTDGKPAQAYEWIASSDGEHVLTDGHWPDRPEQ